MMNRESLGAELHSVLIALLIALQTLKSGKLANDRERSECAAPAEASIISMLLELGYTIDPHGLLVDHHVTIEPDPPAEATEHASFAKPEDI